MLASEIITDVRRELLESNAGFWSDSELLRHLNRAQMDFVNRTRILEDQAFLSTTDNVRDYPLPDNWMSAKLVLFNSKKEADDDDSWIRLRPTSLEKMGQENPNFLNSPDNEESQPYQYFIWNKRIYLYPNPRAVVSGDLYLFYKSKPIQLTATTQSIEIDETLSEALTAYVLWKCWAKAKETALATEQKGIYAGYIGEGRRWAKRRSGDQRYKVDIISPISFNEGTSFDNFWR